MKNITPFIIIIFVAIAISGAIIVNGKSGKNLVANTNYIINPDENFQTIKIKAKGGFSPEMSRAKADTPTRLEIQTNNTFDCSSSVIIPSLKIAKTMPSTGSTTIDIPPQSSGSSITGICSMNMYQFKINFI